MQLLRFENMRFFLRILNSSKNIYTLKITTILYINLNNKINIARTG